VPFAAIWFVATLIIAPSFFYAMIHFVFPMYMFAGVDREQTLPAGVTDGELLAAVTCGGLVGTVRFSGPLLRVRLFTGGLAIKPLFMDGLEIPRTCVQAVVPKREWFTNGLQIEHDCPGIPRQVRLCVKPESDFAVALSKSVSARLLAQQAHRADAAS